MQLIHKTSTVFSYLLIKKGWQWEKQIWSFLPEKPRKSVKLFWLFSTYLTTLNMRQKSYFKTHEFRMISYFKKISRATLLAKFDAMPLTVFCKQRKQNSSFCLPNISNSKLRRRWYSQGQAGKGLVFVWRLVLYYSSPLKRSYRRSLTQARP